MKLIVLVCVGLFSYKIGLGQETVQGSSGWYTYVGNYRLTPQWGLHFDSQVRLKSLTGDLQQWKNRVAVNRQVKSNRTASTGYAFAILGGDNRRYEHRVYQQWIRRAPWKFADAAHRVRLEQRWIDGDFQLRTRYSVRATRKLSSNSDWYVGIGNEYQYRLSEGRTDQNRANFGFGRKLGQNLSLEASYINQFVPGKERNQMNHILQLSILTHLTIDWD